MYYSEDLGHFTLSNLLARKNWAILAYRLEQFTPFHGHAKIPPRHGLSF
jgi:hypothetical protein